METYASLINKAVLEPRVSPAFAITYLCNYCNIRFENTSKYVDTLTLFSKNLNQRSLTPRWPLTPHVCWGHMCDSTQGSLCPSPMGIHQCMWIQWSILQITTYIHIHTYYVQNEWSHSLLLNSVQARQKEKTNLKKEIEKKKKKGGLKWTIRKYIKCLSSWWNQEKKWLNFKMKVLLGLVLVFPFFLFKRIEDFLFS